MLFVYFWNVCFLNMNTQIMDGSTANPQEEKLALLKEQFPEIFKDGKIDSKALRQTVGEEVIINEGEERYGLNWAGKSECFRKIQETTTNTLTPAPEESVNFDESENIFIEGDNLEVLKTLQKSYYGKVKMIYIDPPYNTGNDFIYSDKFTQTKKEYLQEIGAIDENGDIVNASLYKQNTRDSGHFHSTWLNMMYPRLFLARNLLKKDGVIFVSIDDNEVANLRKMMDEIFGEENFVAEIVWQKKYSASNDAKGIPPMHDYILAFQKTEEFDRFLLPRTEKQNAPYKLDDNDGKGLYRSDNLLVRTYSKNCVYPIKNPNTGEEFFPKEGNSWRANKETMDKWIKENRIFFGKDGKGAPQLKRYLNEVQQGVVPNTWWNFEDGGHNDQANKDLQSLFGDRRTPFDTPKPVKLLERILRISTSKDDIILDFFAGSGTTAHAVMQLNAEDGGNRKFMCVQLNEKCKDGTEAKKAGYNTIADIAKERIRRAGRSIAEEHGEKAGDTGFKAYRLSESNFKIWNTKIESVQQLQEQMLDFLDNVRPEATEEGLLIELMLKSGYSLTEKAEKGEAEGKAFYRIGDGKLVITLAEGISKPLFDAILSGKPEKIMCLDRSFEQGNESLKTNLLLQAEREGVKEVLVI